MDTASPWILANNPKAPYWVTKLADSKTGDRGFAGNEHYLLANLRSSRPPLCADPEEIEIVDSEKACSSTAA
jgi:hypothetical protein